MKAFKQVAWIAGASAMTLTAWSAVTTQAALAEVKVALVRSVDEQGLNPYQAGFITLCPNGYCDIEFPVVPPGKRLVVTHVSAITGDTAVTHLSTDIEDAPIIWLSGRSQEVHYYVDAGQKPVIHVSLGEEKVGVTVVGYLVSIP